MSRYTNKLAQIVSTFSKKVSCSGENSTSSHPLIYLTIKGEEGITCPYCSKHFMLVKK